MPYPLLTSGIVDGVTAGRIENFYDLNSRYNFEGPKVKGDFGAVGNSNHNTGGGTDDTTAFQNAINAAQTTPTRFGAVFVEPGTYRCGTLKMHKPDGSGGAIALIGLGTRNEAGVKGPTIVYDGSLPSATGTLLDYDTTGSNVGACPLMNLNLAGIWSPGGQAVRYRKKADTGTVIDNVWFSRFSGDSIVYDVGCTNAYDYRSRWDACIGYGIRLKFGSNSILGVADCTMDNFNDNPGVNGSPLGFFYGERDGLDFNDKAMIRFQNINLECQIALAVTESGGAEEADKRGWYQFLAHTHASTQYVVSFANLKHDTAPNMPSYSVFQMRDGGGTSAAQRGRRIIIVGDSLVGTFGDGSAATGHRVPLGNVAAAMQSTGTGDNYARFEHKPQNTELGSSQRAITWQYVGTD